MGDKDYIPQKDLNNSKPISIGEMQIILEQMKKSICKIDCNDGGNGTGFLCEISCGDWVSLSYKVLITNDHVLNQKDILPNKKIKISLDNENKILEIFIDKSRITYNNPKYDISIIEIKQSDGLNKDSFIKIDESIFSDNPNRIYMKKPAYLLQYPKGKEVKIGQGIIKSISDDYKNIYHYCYSYFGSSGGPIIDMESFKVIGIHKGAGKSGKWNVGTFMRLPIEEFIKIINIKRNKNNSENANEINQIIINNMEKDKIEENIDVDEILIKYKINFENEIIIFGDKFVENNKNICKMFINGKEKELSSTLDINNIELNDDKILELKLKGIKNISNISYMFSNCSSLFEISDISKWNTINITDMSHLFEVCELSSLFDISKWETSNVINMSYMFSNCASLSSLPDLSCWNTKNVIDISYILDNCSSLKSLPDISKWDVKNVINMSHIFNACFQLEYLPDLSKWETRNVKDMSYMFSNCKSLSFLPNISNWNTENVTNISWMFSSLSVEIPDISNWNIKNVKNLRGLFYDCNTLTKLPNISHWNTKRVTDMKAMFYNCKSLLSLPDISFWNTKNVIDISHMFEECQSLSYLPDLSKWNTKKVMNMGYLFYNCKSLKVIPDISQWNIEKVSNMSHMFYNCESLLSLPNNLKWDTKYVLNMESMYEGCKSLSSVHVSKWDFEII